MRENDPEGYFGGRMLKAEGWSGKDCQICPRSGLKTYHVHHVYGHPDHSRLIILCPGCHDLVSQLALRREWSGQNYARLIWFAHAQRAGAPVAAVEVDIG
jgi:hypothetical protein